MSNHAISGTVLCLAATFILSPAHAITQQELVAKHMEDFFFGEGAALPPGYVPQQSK